MNKKEFAPYNFEKTGIYNTIPGKAVRTKTQIRFKANYCLIGF